MLNGLCLVWGNVCISFANLVWFLIYHFTLEFSHSLPFIQLLPPNADKDRKHEWAETHCLYLFMFLSDSYSVICSLNHHSSSSSKKQNKTKKGSVFFCWCSVFVSTFLEVWANWVRKTKMKYLEYLKADSNALLQWVDKWWTTRKFSEFLRKTVMYIFFVLS